MKNTQRLFVLNALKDDGQISRNYCLQNYISRLGAIINRLKSEGYNITGNYKKGDFIYKLN